MYPLRPGDTRQSHADAHLVENRSFTLYLRLASLQLARPLSSSSKANRHLSWMGSKAHAPPEPVDCVAELFRKLVEVDLIVDIEDGAEFHLRGASEQANEGAAHVGQPFQVDFRPRDRPPGWSSSTPSPTTLSCRAGHSSTSPAGVSWLGWGGTQRPSALTRPLSSLNHRLPN
jgi:hypothetical protein